MIYWLALILGGGIVLFLLMPQKRKHYDYLEEINKTILVATLDNDRQAVNLTSLSDETFSQKLSRFFNNTYRQIGTLAVVKVVVFCVLLAMLALYLNRNFIQGNLLIVLSIVEALGMVSGVFWLRKRERNQFEETFPDALNMLASAVSSGESIMHAIMFVGRTLEGDVGKEFKLMGERLQLGESPDGVFRKSCTRFPYPSFQFFVITLRANMHRGGQLKEVITRLNRLMFDARAVEKKKYALTSEARTSAKIVGAIPFVFLFMLQYLSPENYEYVMFNPDGKPILYYVLVSEAIGMFIIWALMRGVRS